MEISLEANDAIYSISQNLLGMATLEDSPTLLLVEVVYQKGPLQPRFLLAPTISCSLLWKSLIRGIFLLGDSRRLAAEYVCLFHLGPSLWSA